jgi:two-component system chemotaxis sensor kinase CheA
MRPRSTGAFRAVHTLKGSTGLFDLAPMGLMLHAAEDLLTLLRGERTGSVEDFEALLSVLDQVDRWLDALDRTGLLPPDAQREPETPKNGVCRRLDRLGRRVDADGRGGADHLASVIRSSLGWASWPSAIFRSPTAISPATIPIAIVAAAPGITGLKLSPREPWGELGDYDPYACNLVIEAVSSAPRADIEAAFRFVADQVEIVDLGRPSNRRREAKRERARAARCGSTPNGSIASRIWPTTW